MPRLFAVLSTQKALLTSKGIRSATLDRIDLLKAKSAEATVKGQRCYKTSFAIKVRQVPSYDKGDLVYLRDDLPRRDDNPSHKLKPEKSGPFLVVTATPKIVATEKNAINNCQF